MAAPETAEKLMRRRANTCIVLAILFMVSGAAGMQASDGWLAEPGPSLWLRTAAWIIWGGVLLLVLATGGGWARGRAVRAIMNDESTLRHRQEALATGYWAAIFSALSLYVLNQFAPFPAADALRLTITVAVSAALLAFGNLEHRALRDA